MTKDLTSRMLAELKSGEVFRTAHQHNLSYLEGVMDARVFPGEEALEALTIFDEELPQGHCDPVELLNLLQAKGAPATVSTLGGRYFGLVTGSALPASLGARLMADAWDQVSTLYAMSPITAKLEEVAESWLKQIFNLPPSTVAGFVSGSSMAIQSSLAAARYRVLQNLGWDINAKGWREAPPVRVITGRHTHSTVVKGLSMLGFGTDNIEYVDVDDQGRIITAQVPELDESCILLLQAGNVNSGAFDDFEVLCDRANKVNAWVHIDGAFGLWAAASERLAHLTQGIEKATSWSVDGHKTLNTPYDSGFVLCADREALVNALQASGAYIVYSDKRDGMLYTPEMSRRARGTEVWAALKYLGREGLDDLIWGMHERAVQAAEALNAEGFEVLNDVVFNQVLVATDDDALTERMIGHIQQSGECWVGGSRWFDRHVIRLSVCSWATTPADIARSVKAFVDARTAVS